MESPFEESCILKAHQQNQPGNEPVEKQRSPFMLSSPRNGASRRPSELGDMGTPTRSRRQFDLPGTNLIQPKTPDNNIIERKLKEIMKLSGILRINGIRYQSTMNDLKEMGELGFGTSGHVFKMLHVPSQEIIAVKQMRRSGNPEENKRIAMDLEVVLKSHDCPYIVQCLGCFITDAEVWICMELMSTCFDKLLKRLTAPIPEPIVGKVTLATVRALHYLKEMHGVIHRDVKPSNILLDNRGNVKLCDFGISGHLVNSKADTKNAGCTAYLAPERINPPDPLQPTYDIRADVWSLGITLVELATGVFPYPGCESDFEVLSRVLQDEPPSLPEDQDFSPHFRDFVKSCLSKDYRVRPKYRKLLEHAFLRKYMEETVDVASWYARCTPVSPSPIHRTGSQGHQRSLSDVSSAAGSTSAPSNFANYRLNSPLLGRRQNINGYIDSGGGGYDRGGGGGGSTSPLILQRFYHQQAHRHRSTSVSPCRQLSYNGMKNTDETPPSSAGTRRKLSSYLRMRLGGCGGGSASSSSDTGPEPPPRVNRTASPLLTRRNHLEADLTSSPILTRRYVSPSPPQPPPRRLSESMSMPGSPHHTRLAIFTPQPLRRMAQQGPPAQN
ncbi:dual specificity mitogen-activated protein kinase kinase 7-like [Cimex lectularius]|uniref:mitogen-activated protein kinase kinase n=1 Tax=Cimex lectularius TaxID=79782 RepID=A0A8I6RYC1_CIMLE|nr:dual specificity mitogen-activated protein kinase kinase 7-like [Cimex lectularius]